MGQWETWGFRQVGLITEGGPVVVLVKVHLVIPDLSLPGLQSLTSRVIEKHVQCTEQKPTCSRCERLNLRCEYGLRLLWREDAAQRGICLGRKGQYANLQYHRLILTTYFYA